jgi:predicted site-specific integrase-resolvase
MYVKFIIVQNNLYIDGFSLIIEDIGSGLNLNKRGINKIIHLGIKGKINELVVAYKDRLTRFGFELIEDIIKTYSNGTIKILNNKEEISQEEELVKDVMAIMNVYVAKMNVYVAKMNVYVAKMNVYVAKMNGLRRYKNK